MSTESTQPDELKYWHCDFCHRGLTARDIHDITDHKVRCYTCAAKGAPENDVAEPKATGATSWDDLLGAFAKPTAAPTQGKDEPTSEEKPRIMPPEIDSRMADVMETQRRRAWLIFGLLIERDILPLPDSDGANDTPVVIDALYSALMLAEESFVPWDM